MHRKRRRVRATVITEYGTLHYINEHLVIDGGSNASEQAPRSNCSVAYYFLEKRSWCVERTGLQEGNM